MSQTVAIPELHLFSSRRCHHHSPTRDVAYDSYKNTRKTIEYYDRISAEQQKIAAFRQNRLLLPPPPIIRQPIPIPTAISVPVPVAMPFVQYPLDAYEIAGPALYPEINRQFIRAPSTYLEYAEEYLMGRRAPIIPQTARFRRSSPNTSRRVEQNRGSVQNNIVKDIYLKKEQPKQEQPKRPVKPINPGHYIPAEQPQKPQIIKDPYITIDTKRQSPKRIVTNQATQTQTENNNQLSPGNYIPPAPAPVPSPTHSQKYTKTITKTTIVTDSKSFYSNLNSKISQFNNIHIRFDDIPTIDLDELYEAKQQYLETSRDILVRLNQLAGDRSALTLTYKLVQSQNKHEMRWPDI